MPTASCNTLSYWLWYHIKAFWNWQSSCTKKIKSTNYIQETLNTFCDISASTESILQSRSEVISALNGGVPYEGLDILRLRKFGSKVAAGSISVQVQSLPPTADAANFHIKRAYLQCRYWMTDKNFDPCQWGWYLSSGKLFPVITSKPAAPAILLKTVKCNCKTNCDSRRCTCRKSGLDCSVSCGICRGTCSNSSDPDLLDTLDDANENCQY